MPFQASFALAAETILLHDDDIMRVTLLASHTFYQLPAHPSAKQY
jgi:hypothetical protein